MNYEDKIDELQQDNDDLRAEVTEAENLEAALRKENKALHTALAMALESADAYTDLDTTKDTP
jgi:FtsZ-binding cell division protein ZapB